MFKLDRVGQLVGAIDNVGVNAEDIRTNPGVSTLVGSKLGLCSWGDWVVAELV